MEVVRRADLHVHSKYSNKPSIWALRKFNCPESYSSPDFIYRTARRKGMDFVTITDHNSINGAVEIAHREGAFLSTEVTTYLPESGCKLHVVALGVTESDFDTLMHLRKNLYDLVGWLRRRGIVHFLAHPLYDMNGKLDVDTMEKLVLLFDVFEVKNGARAPRYNRTMEQILSSLNPEMIGSMSDRHDIEPYGEKPWIKATVGGSDDHSGLYVARAYTEAKECRTVKEFLMAVREGRARASGDDGNVLTLAHSIYGIGYRFVQDRIARKSSSFPFISALLKKVMNEEEGKATLFDKINLLIRKSLPDVLAGGDEGTFEEILDREARRMLSDGEFLRAIRTEELDRKIFAVTSRLANRLLYMYTGKMTRTCSPSGIGGLFNSLWTIGLVHLLTAPYYVAFHHQHRSKALLESLSRRFPAAGPETGQSRIALFTDTLHEINGVAITIRRLIDTARKRGVDLVVITSNSGETGFSEGVMNFRSLGMVSLPEYPDLQLHFPPVLDIIDYIEKEGFASIHASTPGTLGLLGLFIAKLMDIPIAATYHTDIPRYVGELTNDMFLEGAAWNYMIWFYSLMEEVMVPSASTRAQLVARGLPAEKARPLPRWVDTVTFTPDRRNHTFWNAYGLDGGLKFLYVGRISREKNLQLLADAFKTVVDGGLGGDLIFVGDGPFRKELEEIMEGYPAAFTGFLAGEALCSAFASADVFVFPSTTDTFGNVVLEAQASGIPVIVSDEGGPRELMRHGETGLVVRANDLGSLVGAMSLFLKNPGLAADMGRKARDFTLENGIDAGLAYSTILRAEPEHVGGS
jgi:glycosyltransferase involved in cell wall biosynthesis